jgi:hypothetical protein
LEKEGEGFLSLTLPSLGAALESALEEGFLTRVSTPSFGHDPRRTIPKFLKGLFRKIFSEDGKLLSEPDADAIFGIRQICYWFKKPKANCSDLRIKKAIAKFRSVEEDLDRYTAICSDEDPILRRVSDLLWAGSIFTDLTPERLVPRHGPGATAEHLSQGERHDIKTWYHRLEDTFPSDLFAVPNWGHAGSLERVSYLSEAEELPVRVVLVPKTLKTPRVIAIEPSHVQYAQQGLMLYLTEKIESYRLTRESIRFADQSVNKLGAQRASRDRKRATLDLSDASDRVHNELVKNVFRNSPVLDYLQSSRSTRAVLPDDKTPLTLRKFASMGSACCFPVEAMVFYTLIQVAIHYQAGITPTFASIARFSRDIDVYGDDIIVPTHSRRIVQTALEAFGLRVNGSKSFSKGWFRESCGGDYYRGYDVTPIYLRHQCPDELHHSMAEQMMSLTETSNLLYRRGLWRTCQHLRDLLDSVLRSKTPRSPYEGPGLVYHSYMFSTSCRWNDAHQGFAQKRVVFQPKKQKDPSTELGSLFRTLLGMEHSPEREVSSPTDLTSSVKRGSFRMKRRWVPATLGGFIA